MAGLRERRGRARLRLAARALAAGAVAPRGRGPEAGRGRPAARASAPTRSPALAYRAREGLRQAFVSMHAQDADDERCATTRAQLGAFIRNDISKRDGAAVEAHLRDCRECAAIYLELVEVNSDLRALLAPILLGGAATAYLSGTGAVPARPPVAPACSARSPASWPSNVGKSVAGAAAAASVAVAAASSWAWRSVPGGQEPRESRPRGAGQRVRRPGRPDAARGDGDGAGRPRQAPPSRSRQAEQAGPHGPGRRSPRSGRPRSRRRSPSRTAVAAPSRRSPHSPTDQPTRATGPTPSRPSRPDRRAATRAARAGRRRSRRRPAGTGGLAWVVNVSVTGLDAGERGTITVTLDRPAARHPPRPAVRPGQPRQAHLPARRGPAAVRLLVTPLPGAATTLTAVLRPGDDRSSVRLV